MKRMTRKNKARGFTMKTEEILNENNEEQQRAPMLIDLIRLNAEINVAFLEFKNFIEEL